jgi:hypothetical protein
VRRITHNGITYSVTDEEAEAWELSNQIIKQIIDKYGIKKGSIDAVKAAMDEFGATITDPLTTATIRYGVTPTATASMIRPRGKIGRLTVPYDRQSDVTVYGLGMPSGARVLRTIPSEDMLFVTVEYEVP